jgi:hypothetical protein
MRRVAVETLSLAALLALVAVSYAQPGAGDGGKAGDPDKGEKKPAKKSVLEEMLEQALRHNPDIKVAEAKLHEAEAELNRTRLAVTQKVATLYAALDAARKGVEAAETDLARVSRAYKAGTVAEGELHAAVRAVAVAKAALAKAEAEVPYLLGKAAEDDNRRAAARALAFLAAMRDAEMVRDLDRIIEARWQLSSESRTGPMAERIRKALDSTVTLNYRNKPATEILTEVFKKADVPLHLRVKLEGNLTLESKEPLTLGAAVQMFQDFLDTPVRFVVRDYGILVVDARSLPSDAVVLHTFWKSDAGKLKADDTAKNAPEDLKGLVTQVDSTNNLLKINIGSDAGLLRGHTLEVYRVNDKQPKYLGRVRVVEVNPTSAVVQPVGKMQGPVEKGDNVASRIRGS